MRPQEYFYYFLVKDCYKFGEHKPVEDKNRLERGAGTMIGLLIVFAITIGILIAGAVIRAVTVSYEAKTAADISAHAAAAHLYGRPNARELSEDSCAVARKIAKENNAKLTDCIIHWDRPVTVQVAVEVSTVIVGRASSRAGPRIE